MVAADDDSDRPQLQVPPDFAAGLGEIAPHHRTNFHLPGYPGIMVVGNVRDADGKEVAGSAVGRGWHSDMSYTDNPSEFTCLYGVTIPPLGGDTQFKSLYSLYEALDSPTREFWVSLEVEHLYRSRERPNADRQAIHPLVRRHPDSGRSSVYASPGFTVRVRGLPEADSDAILQRLAEAVEPPDYVHVWEPGDLLVWDNRAVIHKATEHDPGEQRCCWRVSVRPAEAQPAE